MNIGTILLIVYLTIGVVVVMRSINRGKLRDKHSDWVLFIATLVMIVLWLPALIFSTIEEEE